IIRGATPRLTPAFICQFMVQFQTHPRVGSRVFIMLLGEVACFPVRSLCALCDSESRQKSGKLFYALDFKAGLTCKRYEGDEIGRFKGLQSLQGMEVIADAYAGLENIAGLQERYQFRCDPRVLKPDQEDVVRDGQLHKRNLVQLTLFETRARF